MTPIFQLMQMSQQQQHCVPIIGCGLFIFDFTLIYSVSSTSLKFHSIEVQMMTP